MMPIQQPSDKEADMAKEVLDSAGHKELATDIFKKVKTLLAGYRKTTDYPALTWNQLMGMTDEEK